MAKKMSTLDAYMKLCFGSKLLINGKSYAYRDINKGKVCSLSNFEKFLARMLNLDTRDMEQYSQVNLFEMIDASFINR